MAVDVTEIQNRIASMTDQSSTAPTVGGDDWTLRLMYMNMAQQEAFELYDWKFLYKEYITQTSTSTGNTSIAMPADFRKLGGYPQIGGYQYAEKPAQERFTLQSTDRAVYLLGSAGNGVTMVVNGALASGASIVVPYYANGYALVLEADVSLIPDADYLVYRSIALLWEAREDDRFPQAKSKAEQILSRMLERENVFSEAANDEGRVRTVEESKYRFRLGRD
jgi:hypothetical protein